MTLISEVMKPLALIGVLILMYAYFRLWGHSAEGQDNINFLGLYLDDKQRTGFMLVLSVIIFLFASSGKELITRAVCGTMFVTCVHGVFRRPHMAVAYYYYYHSVFHIIQLNSFIHSFIHLSIIERLHET